MTNTTDYLLGHDERELDRLEQQAELLAPPTALILRSAGLQPGMRVLDLGTGAGDVAFAAAELVGRTGEVLGIDRSAESLDHAARRARRRGLGNVTFVEGDIETAEPPGDYDAVVGRLVLLYTTDPAGVIAHHARRLRPGGVWVAMEYDMTAAGLLPPTELCSTAVGWIVAAFRRSGHDPLLGPQLRSVFRRAGLGQATMVGIQGYVEPDDPSGARMAAGIVRTLLPVIVREGIAAADDVDIDTLESRLAADQAARGAWMKPPTLVGAWARV